jgi:hypothetical protein
LLIHESVHREIKSENGREMRKREKSAFNLFERGIN